MKDLTRCSWVGADPIYIKYHDIEWGVPVGLKNADDQTHFEFLILEGAQAGLSWLTILKRREGYRRVFHNFDAQLVAKMTDKDIEKALQDPGIIRNRLKVTATVNNAKVFLQIQNEFGSFSSYIWQFVDNKTKNNSFQNLAEVPASTKESDRLSADLKSRGMSFVGSTIIYAHMQATGLVNDHTIDCFRYHELTTG
jgi:DNA-3-methyladenine glycosylase I